jgi:hypothetical protein
MKRNLDTDQDDDEINMHHSMIVIAIRRRIYLCPSTFEPHHADENEDENENVHRFFSRGMALEQSLHSGTWTLAVQPCCVCVLVWLSLGTLARDEARMKPRTKDERVHGSRKVSCEARGSTKVLSCLETR